MTIAQSRPIFSATPYNVLDKCALTWRGSMEASTMRTLAVSYTLSFASTTPVVDSQWSLCYNSRERCIPPRSRLIMAAVPMGCATDENLYCGSFKIQSFQASFDPPSGSSGTEVNPGTVSPTVSPLFPCRSVLSQVTNTKEEMKVPHLIGGDWKILRANRQL